MGMPVARIEDMHVCPMVTGIIPSSGQSCTSAGRHPYSDRRHARRTPGRHVGSRRRDCDAMSHRPHQMIPTKESGGVFGCGNVFTYRKFDDTFGNYCVAKPRDKK